jgi:putative lipoic acid-binding regulatory protein
LVNRSDDSPTASLITYFETRSSSNWNIPFNSEQPQSKSPTRLQFKIVGLAYPNFVADMERICAETCGKPVTASSTRDKGKYRSITMDLDIQSADAFYRIYETVGKDPRVKFMI